jgi:4-hydroxybenzoate polyprenyltransferase
MKYSFISQLNYFWQSLRPLQWIKNFFIFAPVIFSLHIFEVKFLLKSSIAFCLFSLIAGTIYIFNDCFDKNLDKFHPKKKYRPIVSGKLSLPVAIFGAIILLCSSLLGIFLFHKEFFWIALVYIIINIFYSKFLKTVVILDIMIIALGFVFRVKIGGVINDIDLSPWILIITYLLAIFLALIKRRQELIKVKESNDNQIRLTLKKYNLPLLDQLISITTATTLISYIIYILNPEVMEKFNTKELYLTVPFVIFGIFRYLYLTFAKDKGENPAEIFFSDIAFTINIIAWLMVFALLIYT